MLCNKCRIAPPYQEDTWCLACSAVEALSSELKARWELPGLREAAEESIISAARQVKSLRRLSVGLAAERAASKARERAKQAEAALSSRPARSPLPRSTSRTPQVPNVKAETFEKDEEESADEEESYSEEERPTEEKTLPGASRLPSKPGGEVEAGGRTEGRSRGSERPSEPAEPPASSERRKRNHRESHREGDRKRRRRGGAKHKRLSRLVDNPETRVHRSFAHQSTDQDARRKTW